ncbi:uncharacterized protein LOC144207026 [Stigmatopora nigra]
MRPPSATLSKGGALLPTITEEVAAAAAAKDRNQVKDGHEAKARRLSSDDYLLSICHLAHPTFPAGHVQAGPPTRARPSRLNRGQKARDDGVQRRRQSGATDPLEYLFGRQSYPGQGDQGPSEGEREKLSLAVPRADILGHPRPRRVPGGSAPTGRAGEDGEAKGGGEGTPGKSAWLLSQWIWDCRSAWREGRMRACVLPVITEI